MIRLVTTVERIQKIVAAYFGLTMGELLCTCRLRRMARPRMIAMLLTRELTALSFPRIAASFNKRHHTTVIHAVQWGTNNPHIYDDLKALRKLIERPDGDSRPRKT